MDNGSIHFYHADIIIYLLVLGRLITSNHWTEGKRVICMMFSAYLWYQLFAVHTIVTQQLNPNFKNVMVMHLPMTCIGAYLLTRMIWERLNYYLLIKK